jgi:hypothetical protein
MFGHLRPPLAALALTLALAACSAGEGGVTLHVSDQGIDDAAVAAVRLTVGPGDGPGFTPFSATASRTALGWEVVVGAVPSGPGRYFSVEALDASSAPLLAGAARADVVAGSKLDVLVVLQPPAAAPTTSSRPPVISSLAVWSPVVDPGGEAWLQAVATGAPGEVLTYEWTSTPWCGSFGAPDATETSWSSVGVFPSTICPLSFRVTSASGGSVEVTVPVTVGSGASAP